MKKLVLILFFVSIAIAAAMLLSSSEKNQTNQLADALVLGDNFQVYKNEQYRFSLEYPKDYQIEEIQEKDGAETIVFQGPTSVIASAPAVILSDSEESRDPSALPQDDKGFQIFITPFEESALTKERILQDIPSAVLKEAQEAIIGVATGENIKSLLFWSEDPMIGRTREVWFVHAGHLYEITAYAHMDELLSGIMSTWDFEK